MGALSNAEYVLSKFEVCSSVRSGFGRKSVFKRVARRIDNLPNEFDPSICAIVVDCHALHSFLPNHEFELPFKCSIRVSSILRNARSGFGE